MLTISVGDVMLPTLTTWGRPIRKSRIQLQREVFTPRVLSLVMSFEGAMVLNTELFLLSRWERTVWSATEIASSVDLFGRYAN